MKYTFTGAFAPFICGLIEKKQALGHDYHGSACILRTFDKFCREQFPHETCLTAELAMKWAEQSKTEKNLSRLNRVSVVRELAKYMNSVGEQAYLLPLQLTKKTGRHIPYIYSKEDLSKLFKEMDSLQPSLRSPTKHLVVSVIFRMIYCCGLRPVEARRLRREDVNLFDGTVNILESKGHKDRIVVLSEDMRELCRNYDQRVEAIHPERRYFFQSPSVRGDGMYSMEWIIPTFRKFLQTAGISGYGEIRPRLYDLRHTFATHRLYQWVKEGKDINACLAYLSEYMGHSNLESTAYYIHLLPTLYTDLPELHLDLRLMAIRSFTKYAGILDSGKIYMQVEVGNISIRKTPGTVVEFLTVPALETLFEQPNRFKTNGYRDFCFMRLMYDTAARCQELVDAKIHDLIIRKTHATICLAGKGNKLRIVPISPSVVELLKTYLDKAHPTEQRQSDDYLFFTTHHGCKNRMSTDAVNLFMKKYGETARRACPEVPERVHPHQLRHSRAMHLYRAGMPLVLLSEFLGHADVNTTRIYAWADTEMKRQAIQKVSKATAEDSIEPIWANDEEMIKRLYGLA